MLQSSAYRTKRCPRRSNSRSNSSSTRLLSSGESGPPCGVPSTLGLTNPSVEGTPQGGPLSPLLSNLVLDEFDRELTRRGLRFCRYADDCNIYVRSRRAGERVMASACRFLTTRLQLKVNESKSAVARSGERKFLGFTISNDPEPTRQIAAKALEKFKERVRELTSRTLGVSVPQLIA